MNNKTIDIQLAPQVSNTCSVVKCLKSVFCVGNGHHRPLQWNHNADVMAVDDSNMFIFDLLSLFILLCVKHTFPA